MSNNIRAVRPDIKLICTAENANPYQGWNGGMVSAVGAAALSRACDGFSVHLYTGGAYVDPNTPGPSDGSAFSFDRVDKMKAKFATLGISNKTYWVTEFGWSLYTMNVSDSQRATYYSHFFPQVAARPWIVATFPYNLYSYYQNSSNKETAFGLINTSTGKDTAAAPVVRNKYASLP
jgi:hypothetical protein